LVLLFTHSLTRFENSTWTLSAIVHIICAVFVKPFGFITICVVNIGYCEAVVRIVFV